MCALAARLGLDLTSLTGRRMIVPLLLLLLVATVHTGSSYRRFNKDCGSKHKIILMSAIDTIRFTPDSLDEPVLLWKRNAPINKDPRRKVSGIYFVISNLLKRDGGTYTTRDKEGEVLQEDHLVVTEISQSVTAVKSGEFSFSAQVEDQHCNIHLKPYITYGREDFVLVLKGVKQETWPDCQWWQLTKPCGFQTDHMNIVCAGEYEIRDDRGDKVLVVDVKMEEDEPAYLSHIGTGLGIFFLLSGCCFCMKHCCCGKKSKKRQSTDDVNVDDVPTTEGHRQYDAEPVTRRPVEVNQPTQPRTHPAPAVHPTYNPTVHIPPAYTEVTAPTAPLDPPPLYSEVDPRFELTCFPSAPPLSSDSAHSNVYTSDKLNFL